MKNKLAFLLLPIAGLLLSACSSPDVSRLQRTSSSRTQSSRTQSSQPRPVGYSEGPSVPDRFEDTVQHWQSQAERDPEFRQKVREELRNRVAETSPTPARTQAEVPGPALSSTEELSTVIRSAGYVPHSDPGYVPYFQGFTPQETATMNLPLPNGLKVYYIWGKDSLVFIAELRLLRPTDPPTIIETLNAGVPFFLNARFATLDGDGGQTLIAFLAVPNSDVSPDVVRGTVAKFALVLTPNQKLWR